LSGPCAKLLFHSFTGGRVFLWGRDARRDKYHAIKPKYLVLRAVEGLQ
jgi:hypothetical protein